MSEKKIKTLANWPLFIITLVIITGASFYLINVVHQNKIAAQNINIERTINEISYAHIYYLTAVKEKRGYQLTKTKNYLYKYEASKNSVQMHLNFLKNIFLIQKEIPLFTEYENNINLRFVEMDKQLNGMNEVGFKEASPQINKAALVGMEEGSEEEELYASIIKSLKTTGLHLDIKKENIEKFNYAAFLVLIFLTVLLVFLNVRQVQKLTYQKLKSEKEKEMLDIVRSSEQEFSAAFEYAPIGIALVGLNGEWLRINKSLSAMLGYSNSELMLCNFQDITHEDDLKTDLELLKKLIDDEIQSYKMPKRYYNKNGDLIWINLSVSKVLNADGSIKYFISQLENINEIKLAELALKNEKERLANVLDGTNAGTWELNIQTGETAYNERWAAIAGYTLQELMPINLNTWRNLVHPEDLKKSDEKLQACFDKKENFYDCECRIKHKNGNWVWVLDRGKVISRTEEGEPLLISGTQIDISAIKNAEQAIKEKQALLETILNSINVGIVACNTSGELTIFNKATQKMHGLPVESLPPKQWASYYNLFEADGTTLLSQKNIPLYQALKSGYVTTEEISIVPNHGNRLVVKCSGSQIKDENGEVYGAVVAMHDITVQNNYEKLLALNEKRFRGIFNATHQLMGFLDMEGNLVETNDTALKFAGVKPEEVIGKKFWDGPWWNHSKEEQHKLKTAFKEASEGKSVQYETTHINAEGIPITILFNLKPLFDDDGEVIAVIPEGRPIQDIADARKRLMEKNDELQQFAGLASHDLKEPLRMIKSFMQLLKKNYGTQLDEKANKYIDFAVDGAGRMSAFINELLSYSNTGSEEVAKDLVNTQLLLNEIVAMQMAVLQEKKAVINYNNLPTIRANKTALLLVFQNLINNAIKYQIKDRLPIVTVSALETNNYWQFSIEDNGIGMEEQDLYKIFDLFKRLHVEDEYSGTGMGLATCKKIVQQHRGKIWVESKIGRGSTFYFEIIK